MKKTSVLTLLCMAIAAAAALPASAEVFTVKMTNQSTFITRYQPRQDPRDEGKVSLLTEFGNWISLHKVQIDEIISETESRAMKPDYYLVLPWHFRDEFIAREREFIEAGGKLIFPLPEVEIYPAG